MSAADAGQRGALAAVARDWMKLWQGDLSSFYKLHDEGFVDHSGAGRDADRDSFRAGIVELYQAFADFSATVADLVTDPTTGKVTVRWDATGHHSGSFMGRAATGQLIRFAGIEIIRIVDGCVVERWGQWDGLDIAAQLAEATAAAAQPQPPAMRRSKQEVDDYAQLEVILARAEVVHLALVDQHGPYVMPMHFGYCDGKLYLHAAAGGRRYRALAESREVAFSVVDSYQVEPAPAACGFGTRYLSVVGSGSARLLSDGDDKRRGLDALMSKFAKPPFVYDAADLARVAVIEVEILDMKGKSARQRNTEPTIGQSGKGGPETS